MTQVPATNCASDFSSPSIGIGLQVNPSSNLVEDMIIGYKQTRFDDGDEELVTERFMAPGRPS